VVRDLSRYFELTSSWYFLVILHLAHTQHSDADQQKHR
jgi:hypothetical protein